MAYTVAFSGKGGVGKTTLCGLFIRYLIENNRMITIEDYKKPY